MSGIRVAMGVIWVAFWVGWIVAAFRAKRSLNRFASWRGRGAIWILVYVFFRVFRPSGGEIHSVVIASCGLAITLAGLGLAVWARIHLGANWGMPATIKQEPELVSSGPYRFIRHPIYTGLIVAFAGTALAFNLVALGVPLAAGAMFIYSAVLEERNLSRQMPTQYPPYKARTKMLIPWVL